MLVLARHGGETPLSSAAIAEIEDVSERYLQQLLGALKRAGLLRASMGPGGGFTLARPPGRITLGEILRTLEGHTCLVECMDRAGACRRAPTCTARRMWQEATETLDRYFDRITLAAVLASAGRRAAGRRAAGRSARHAARVVAAARARRS